MIISHTKKFVMLLPWKAASQTLTARLMPYDESPYDKFFYFNPYLNRIVHQHITCADFVCLPESKLDYLVASFVRNPYDRVYSGFQQLQYDLEWEPNENFPESWIRDHVMKQLAEISTQLYQAHLDFDEWFDGVTEDQIYDSGRNTNFLLHPAHYWTHLGDQQLASFIGRVENFEMDFQAFLDRVNIANAPVINKNVRSGTDRNGESANNPFGYRYIHRMRPESIRKINRLFERDFELLGYEKVIPPETSKTKPQITIRTEKSPSTPPPDKPLVSVCILAYNRPDGLAHTLERITQQSYKNLEIIISDDASPDKRVQTIAEEACARDSRIRYYRQDHNLGIIGNHEFLRQNARGKYLMWACDDDWWHEKYIEVCVEALETHPEAVLCATNSSIVQNSQLHSHPEYVHTLNQTSPAKRLATILPQIQWLNNTFYGMMRRSVASTILFKKRLAFDLFFVAELALRGAFIQLPYFYFRKQMNGIGGGLQQNLAAIKVQSKASALFPTLTFAVQLAADCTKLPQLSLIEKVRFIPCIFWIASQKDPFPNTHKSILNRIKQFPLKLKDWAYYKAAISKIRNCDVTMRLFTEPVSIDEVRYHAEKNMLELPLLNISLRFPDQMALLNGCTGFQKLMHHYDLSMEQHPDGKIIIRYEDIRFYFTASNNYYVFEEVFIHRCYHVHLTKPAIVFDLGMNVGFTSLYFAQFDLVEQLFGYELFPYTAQLAEQNIALNPSITPKIKVFPFGLGNENRTAEMTYSKQHLSLNGVFQSGIYSETDTLETTLVQFRSAHEVLQPILEDYPAHQKILKIDVEGSEYEILDNLWTNNLLDQFDILLIEWHEQGPQSIEHMLEKFGYQILSMTNYQPNTTALTGMIYAFK
ncbi:MAG: FkbM family methyltransferase, partial [Gemmatimonadetes bacterium]